MSKTFTLQEIATAVEGRLIGDGSVRVTRLAHPADVRAAGDLVLAMDGKLLDLLKGGKVSAAIVAGNENDSDFLTARIVVARPRVALARLTSLFAVPVAVKAGVHASAVIEETASIGKNAAIGAQSYIGAHAVIRRECGFASAMLYRRRGGDRQQCLDLRRSQNRRRHQNRRPRDYSFQRQHRRRRF